MRIRRGLLFAGLFLIPLGAMPLLVRAGVIDADSLDGVWQLWPLILIGFGIAILLGRSRAASLGTAIAAVVLGVLVGSAIASGGAMVGSIGTCGLPGDTDQHVDQAGTFTGPATVAIDLRCGSLDLTTGSGSDWTVGADYRGPAPVIAGTGDRLEVRDPDTSQDRRDEWTVATSAESLRTLEVTTNAASGTFRLDGSRPDLVRVDANAGDITIDAGDATVARLDITLNAGRTRITLGAGPTSGSISVNAGAIDLCVPADAALRLDVNEQLTFVTNLSGLGLQHDGSIWTRAGAASAPLIDLDIEGNVASFTLDPNGGCR